MYTENREKALNFLVNCGKLVCILCSQALAGNRYGIAHLLSVTFQLNNFQFFRSPLPYPPLYSTLLYSTLLYSTLLYSTVLYCTLLSRSRLLCSSYFLSTLFPFPHPRKSVYKHMLTKKHNVAVQNISNGSQVEISFLFPPQFS